MHIGYYLSWCIWQQI